MRTVFYIPPLKRISGGLANIIAVALSLHDLGKETALLPGGPDVPNLSDLSDMVSAPGLPHAAEPGGRTPAAQDAPPGPPAPPAARRGARGLPCLPAGAKLEPGDLLCIPEGWPNAMVPALDAGARVTVYAQNWVYMLGVLPKGVRWKDLPVDYLAVSRPVAAFLREALDVPVRGILPPRVNDAFFIPPDRPADRVRIAYLPRKNKASADQAMETAKAKLAVSAGSPPVEWVCIHKAPQREVAQTLASCHLFLATGFPEGFGLPPLEAMASGCVPVGCTGFGGWEYMRQAALPGLTPTLTPPPLFPQPLPLTGEAGGNGFYYADGDSLGAGLGLATAARLAHENGPAWQALCARCREAATRYDGRAQRAAVARIWGGAVG